MSETKATGGGDRQAARSLGECLKSAADSRHLMSLPREILRDILMHVARADYDSLTALAGVSVFFRDLCQDFMKQHPRGKFKKSEGRPAGCSDSEDSDCFDAWDSVNEDRQDDDFNEDMLDQMERLSFGSNLDEEQLDAYLNERDSASESAEQLIPGLEPSKRDYNFEDDEW